MAHFAKVINGVVKTVIVVHNNELLAHGVESEEKGKQFIASIGLTGEWVQTSVNNNFRKQYAGIGFTYDDDADVFIAPRPYPSWSLDDDYDWQPPTPKPDGDYIWNEAELEWVAI